MVHMASVWVPFTSESKEAIAGYPEIQKELRLACKPSAASWACTCAAGMKVKQEGERRNIFLRYLGEVATAVSEINRADREELYEQLLKVAKKKTAEADIEARRTRQADRRGRRRLRRQRADRRADVAENVPTCDAGRPTIRRTVEAKLGSNRDSNRNTTQWPNATQKRRIQRHRNRPRPS